MIPFVEGPPRIDFFCGRGRLPPVLGKGGREGGGREGERMGRGDGAEGGWKEDVRLEDGGGEEGLRGRGREEGGEKGRRTSLRLQWEHTKNTTRLQ